jgi:hypothetical protein
VFHCGPWGHIVHVAQAHHWIISLSINIISQLLSIHNILSISPVSFAVSQLNLSVYNFIFVPVFISNNLVFGLSVQSVDIMILLIVCTALSRVVSMLKLANTIIDQSQIIILKKIIIIFRILISCLDQILLLWNFEFFIIVFIFIKICSNYSQ